MEYARIVLCKIKLSEQVQNYDELVKFIKNVVQTVDRRGLTDVEIKFLKDYMNRNDMSEVCDGILRLVDTHLIPKASSAESKVVYWKMKGDYHKHLAASNAENNRTADVGHASQNNRTADVGHASLAYLNAQGIASTKLPAANSIRLALTLSISEFHLDIHKTPDRAINLAEEALDAAVPEPDDALDVDSEAMFELLAEKIESWRSELPKKEEDQTVDHSSYEE